MNDWLPWAAAAAALFAFSRKAGADGPMTYPKLSRDQLIDLARQESEYHGMPPWILLATAQSESGIQHLAPTGKGQRKTFYPYGIQVNRGSYILQGVSQDELERVMSDPQALTSMAATELKRGYDLYGDDVDRLRMFWAMPAWAKRGAPWPRTTGSYKGRPILTSHRLNRWRRHVEQWGGPRVPTPPDIRADDVS